MFKSSLTPCLTTLPLVSLFSSSLIAINVNLEQSVITHLFCLKKKWAALVALKRILRAGSESDCAETLVELKFNRDGSRTLLTAPVSPVQTQFVLMCCCGGDFPASGPSDGEQPGTTARPKEGRVGEWNAELSLPTSGLSHEHSGRNNKDDTRRYRCIEYICTLEEILNTWPTLTRCKTSHFGRLVAALARGGTHPLEDTGIIWGGCREAAVGG